MQFTELRILNEHVNIHLDLRPFVCEFCSEAFHNSANLRYHRKRHLNPEGIGIVTQFSQVLIQIISFKDTSVQCATRVS